MIESMAGVSQSLRRVVTLIIRHPREASNTAFDVSCAFLILAVLCQFPPSTSMASFISGNAKSRLNLSTANSGIGDSPSDPNALNRAISYALIFAVLCLPRALLHRSAWDRFFPVILALLFAVRINNSSYDLRLATSFAVSDADRNVILAALSHRNTVGIETCSSLAISCAVFVAYLCSSHSPDGLIRRVGFIEGSINKIPRDVNMNGTLKYWPAIRGGG